MLTIRIRTSNGTQRLVVNEEDILSALSPRIQTEFAGELKGRTFRLWREGDASRRNLLSGIDGGRSFREVGLRQGEMLYLEAISEGLRADSIPQPQSVKSASVAPVSQGVESFPLGHVAIYRKIRELFS